MSYDSELGKSLLNILEQNILWSFPKRQQSIPRSLELTILKLLHQPYDTTRQTKRVNINIYYYQQLRALQTQ